MHAYLIVGGNRDIRVRKLDEVLEQNGVGARPGERFVLGGEEGSLKIEDIRRAETWVNLKRNRPAGLAIEEADRLTLPAQHAFLKTLEEPGENILIVLTAADASSLLSTIRSRCKIIRLPASAGGQEWKDSILPNGTVAQRLAGLYPILKQITGSTASLHRGAVKRDEAIKFIESVIESINQHRHPDLGDSSATLGMTLSAAVAAHRRLKNNLNPTLTLHQFIIDISAD